MVRLLLFPVNAVFRDAIDLFVRTMEAAAVIVIVVALVHATGRYLLHLTQHRADAYKQLKTYIGKALLLALEVLIAAEARARRGVATGSSMDVTCRNEEGL